MKAVVLKWNPEISSFKMDDYLKGMDDFEHFDLNWSVWEREQIHKYDPFVMVRVGNENTGIVMSGWIKSDPYKSEDWSGKGRDVYYIDLWITVMVHPEKPLVLSTDELSKQFPDFDWKHGHSGMVLSDEQSLKLMNLWELHQENHATEFNNTDYAQRFDDSITPVFKQFSLEAFLKDYDYEVHTNTEEEYDYLDEGSRCITLKNPEGRELYIDLEGDFTLTFEEWHRHFLTTNEEYDSLKKYIIYILTNKVAANVILIEGEWSASSLTYSPITNKEQAIKTLYDIFDGTKFLKQIYNKGVEIYCTYWDSAFDSSISLAPKELPLK